MKRSREAQMRNQSSDTPPAEVAYQQALALAKKGRKAHAHRAVPLLRSAADDGHAMAAHALATWYIHGIGMRKNFRAAVALEEVAARAGIVEAMFNLAFAYETGRGTDKDTTKALRLYRRAAAKGDRDAMYEVGRCVFYGIGTKKNERLGRKWIERSQLP